MYMCEVMISENNWNYWINFRVDKNDSWLIVDIPDRDVEMLKRLPSEWIYENVNNYVRNKLDELKIDSI